MDSKKLEVKKNETNPIYLKITEFTEYLEKRIEQLRLEEEKFRERVLRTEIKIHYHH